jgi:hypothetical protein
MSAQRRAWFCALGLALSGCGGAAAGAHAQMAPAEEQYQTLDQASAAFERYATELEGPYAANEIAAPAGNAGPPAAAAPSAAPGAPSLKASPSPEDITADRAQSSPSDAREKEEAAPSPKDRCEMPCRAFASMKRAGEAICRLDAPDGAHCTQAKQRLAAARGRVSSCGCTS